MKLSISSKFALQERKYSFMATTNQASTLDESKFSTVSNYLIKTIVDNRSRLIAAYCLPQQCEVIKTHKRRNSNLTITTKTEKQCSSCCNMYLLAERDKTNITRVAKNNNKTCPVCLVFAFRSLL